MKFSTNVVYLDDFIKTNDSGRSYRIVKLLDPDRKDSFQCLTGDINLGFDDISVGDDIKVQFDIYLANKNMNLRVLDYEVNND